MTPSKHPVAVVLLAVLWPIVTISFLLGLRTEGSLFGIPDWFHDALKPLGVVAWVIATWWVARQGLHLIGRKASD